MRPSDLTAAETAIYNRLEGASKWDPVSRRELVYLTRLPDRTVRELIASIRKKGGRVATSSARYGYWIAKTDGEYEELRKEYVSRIRTLSETLRAMDSVVEGQVSWDV